MLLSAKDFNEALEDFLSPLSFPLPCLSSPLPQQNMPEWRKKKGLKYLHFKK